jgi:hypothetical protein
MKSRCIGTMIHVLYVLLALYAFAVEYSKDDI